LWSEVRGDDGRVLTFDSEDAARDLAAGKGDSDFLKAKIATARFHAECLLPQSSGLAQAITHGGEAALALSAAQF